MNANPSMFRDRPAPRTLLVLGLLLAGCGQPPPAPTPAIIRGPHGGMAHRLPGPGAGYVEMVNEPEVDRRSASPTAIVLYFLGPDGKSPWSSGPLSGLAIASEVGRASRTIALTPDPRPGDPAGAVRFASRPGPYDLADVRGTLSGSLAGAAFAIELSGRR